MYSNAPLKSTHSLVSSGSVLLKLYLIFKALPCPLYACRAHFFIDTKFEVSPASQQNLNVVNTRRVGIFAKRTEHVSLLAEQMNASWIHLPCLSNISLCSGTAKRLTNPRDYSRYCYSIFSRLAARPRCSVCALQSFGFQRYASIGRL